MKVAILTHEKIRQGSDFTVKFFGLYSLGLVSHTNRAVPVGVSQSTRPTPGFRKSAEMSRATEGSLSASQLGGEFKPAWQRLRRITRSHSAANQSPYIHPQLKRQFKNVKRTSLPRPRPQQIAQNSVMST
jgi:hypothetical protein